MHDITRVGSHPDADFYPARSCVPAFLCLCARLKFRFVRPRTVNAPNFTCRSASPPPHTPTAEQLTRKPRLPAAACPGKSPRHAVRVDHVGVESLRLQEGQVSQTIWESLHLMAMVVVVIAMVRWKRSRCISAFGITLGCWATGLLKRNSKVLFFHHDHQTRWCDGGATYTAAG